MERLARRNGFPGPKEFGDGFGVRYDDVRLGRATAELARISGLPEDVVDAWSPAFGPGSAVTLRGQYLRYPHDWSIPEDGTPPRACPSCLRGDLRGSVESDGPRPSRPYVRAWWCLRDVHTCPVHGCLLVARMELTSKTRRTDHFWEEWIELPQCPIPEKDLMADRYMMGRLGAGRTISVDVLDDLPLGDASAVITWLGELATVGTSPMDIRSLPFADAARARSNGLALAMKWPGRLMRKLDQLVRDAPSSARGLKGVYGRFYARLYDDRANRETHAGRDLLRRLVEGHALGHVPFDEGERIFKKSSGWSKWVTKANAAAICGVSVRVIDRTLIDFPPDTNPVDGAWRRSIPRGWATLMRDLFATTLDGRTVASLLGVDAEELATLERVGLLDRRAAAQIWSDNRYCRGGVEDVLARFFPKADAACLVSSSSATLPTNKALQEIAKQAAQGCEDAIAQLAGSNRSLSTAIEGLEELTAWLTATRDCPRAD